MTYREALMLRALTTLLRNAALIVKPSTFLTLADEIESELAGEMKGEALTPERARELGLVNGGKQ